MLVVHSKQELADQVREWRHNDEHIALVPTMGNLHAGHLALVELAREHAEHVVVSIFVNPAQFGEDEDYDTYPRTLERDRIRLKTAAADMIFAPDVDTVYPFGIENATTIAVPGLSENYCGAARPGHFEGVTTVVARLFAMVQPDVAVFGQKDYQQQLVIRRMVEDLSLPVSIITSKTIRDDDGLALSSRNAYLGDEQRRVAPMLYERLSAVGRELQNGRRNFGELETLAKESLLAGGFEVEYFAIRRALNLEIPDRDCDDLVVLTAARLGEVRLIDNVVVAV